VDNVDLSITAAWPHLWTSWTTSKQIVHIVHKPLNFLAKCAGRGNESRILVDNMDNVDNPF
jgi:hypothetical protein